VSQQYPLGNEEDPGGAGPRETSGDVMGQEEAEADARGDEAEGSGTIEQRIEEAKERARQLNPDEPPPADARPPS
jgi:uncharacterized protein YjbJ (UPF0337 family)